MKFSDLTILLPCHSLEDFPLHHEGEEAESLLANWTALWHPALLASASRMPSWSRADSPPEILAGRLLVIPQLSEPLLLAGWPARAKSEGACVVRKLKSRGEIVAAALAELDSPPEVLAALVDDFHALGFAYLQVELLTRQMRYMSNLDEVHFQAETIRAAEAAVAGDEAKTKQHLTACFEVLTEARERFYPADCHLIDLTLCATTTLGESLTRELGAVAPGNLLASAELISQLAANNPAGLAALVQAIEEGRVSLVGGEASERETPLLPLESLLFELRRGAAEYARHLPRPAAIFGRRRFGLTPALPQLLVRLGFQGALHATFEDGQFPKGEQSKIRWEGVDSSALDSVCRIPFDASLPQTFLSLPTKLGETMDLDHVATAVFAHWPGQACPWYDDLRRASAYAPVLGKFTTLASFFQNTDMSGRLSKFLADAYRAPYLKQTVIRKQANALSRFTDHYRRRAAAEAWQALNAVTVLLKGNAPPPDEPAADMLAAVEQSFFQGDFQFAGDVDLRLDQSLAAAAKNFAACLPRQTSPAANGYLVANPHSFTRRVHVDLPDAQAAPPAEGPVKASQSAPGRSAFVVEAPPMGFAWIPAGGWQPEGRKGAKPLAEGTTLRNDHMEVLVDPVTGSVRSVNDYRTRGNRLSQQLALRLPGPRPKPGDVWRDPDLDAVYSVMKAESVEITASGAALGEIVSRGQLLDLEGQRLAGFKQTLQLWRGSPVLLIDVELDVVEEPRADPWNSYYAARFAWSDESAEIRRSVAGGSHPTEAKKLEAPLFVEARGEKARTTIFPFGLPYHRRIGARMLDTLLVVRGETQRRFRLGVGLEVAHPALTAMDLLTPAICLADGGPVTKPASSSWLFHLDAKNVAATHWEPLLEEGGVVGFRARFLETEGKPGRAQLRSFRTIASARQTDYRGQTLSDLTLSADALQIDLAAHEWVQIEARW